jgi:exodeoxyribonuclease VII large subunit
MTSLLPNLLIPPTVLSVAGLTGYMQTLLEQDSELAQVWLTGEVSSASQHRSGLFFTLQDPDANAAIRCIAWSNQLDSLTILPIQGEQVILLGRIRLYPQRGEYQLVVWQCLPAGEGLRALRYRQLHDRLAAEGLFDPARKRSLPAHPQTIAVVTSTKAAAWGDIQRTLKFRYPGLKVLMSSAVVQGGQAAESIAAAIARVGQDGRAEVLLLSRGGGATEDMVCFNDERVVRAIAECPIPVITGIGHQRDQSLADLVADVCAHTPTAAAQQVVPNLADLQLDHQARVAALMFSLEACLDLAQNQLEQLRLRLQRLPLDRQLSQESRAIAHLKQHLTQVASQQVQRRSLHQDLLSQKLQSLDPQAVLERGYAIVRQADGRIVRAASQLAPAAELTLQLAQGQVRVKVIDVATAQKP